MSSWSTPNRSRATNSDSSEINAAIGDLWYQPSPEIFVHILVKKRHEIVPQHDLQLHLGARTLLFGENSRLAQSNDFAQFHAPV